MTVSPRLNEERLRRDVVTVGGSAGGIRAFHSLLTHLPKDYRGSIAAVIHRSRFFESSRLATVLSRGTPHRVVEPNDDEVIRSKRIYLAPRDQHMVVDDGRIRLNRGPREHFTRPAIDPLFQSAARSHGPRVIGVLLSGCGDDGVDGLTAIKAAGGISIAQHPHEAEFAPMPNNALVYDHVDLVLPIREIAAAIATLTNGKELRTDPASRPQTTLASVQ